jgi:hypothetical protein
MDNKRIEEFCKEVERFNQPDRHFNPYMSSYNLCNESISGFKSELKFLGKKILIYLIIVVIFIGLYYIFR